MNVHRTFGLYNQFLPLIRETGVNKMTTVIKENLTISSSETEIIEKTDTDKNIDRIFTVENKGDHVIEITAYGSNDDGQTWEEKGRTQIEAKSTDSLIIGPTCYVAKLVGKTINPGDESIVDASLTW